MLLNRVSRLLDNDSQPGVGAPNDPIDPAPGTKGIVAISEMIHGLRDQYTKGEIGFESERDEQAVETIDKNLDAEGAEGAESEEASDASEQEEGGEQTAEGEEETGEEGEEQQTDAELRKIALRGRNPDDPPYEIEVDAETYERLQQNLRDGMRREEFNRRVSTVETREEQLAFVDFQLERDPGAFLEERIPDEVQEDVVLRLLARPGMLEKVLDKVAPWQENPDKREIARLEMVNRSREQQDKINAAFEDKRVGRQAARVLANTLDQIATALPEDRAAIFVDDAFRDVQNYYRTAERDEPLNPGEIVRVLQSRLNLYGVSPEKATALIEGRQSPVPKAKPDAAAAKRLSEQHQQQNRRLVRATQGRRAAAAAAPAGQAAAPRPAAPPKGQGIKERANWVRDMLGLKKR